MIQLQRINKQTLLKENVIQRIEQFQNRHKLASLKQKSVLITYVATLLQKKYHQELIDCSALMQRIYKEQLGQNQEPERRSKRKTKSKRTQPVVDIQEAIQRIRQQNSNRSNSDPARSLPSVANTRTNSDDSNSLPKQIAGQFQADLQMASQIPLQELQRDPMLMPIQMESHNSDKSNKALQFFTGLKLDKTFQKPKRVRGKRNGKITLDQSTQIEKTRVQKIDASYFREFTLNKTFIKRKIQPSRSTEELLNFLQKTQLCIKFDQINMNSRLSMSPLPQEQHNDMVVDPEPASFDLHSDSARSSIPDNMKNRQATTFQQLVGDKGREMKAKKFYQLLLSKQCVMTQQQFFGPIKISWL